MPRGRKSKYQPNMPETVRSMMADGFSKEACAGALGISQDTLYRWIADKPEFSEAIKEGEKLSHKWWEDKGREACADPANGVFNATVWVMQMKNRFNYKDARENHVSVKADPEQVSDIDAWISGAIGGAEEGEDTKTRTH